MSSSADQTKRRRVDNGDNGVTGVDGGLKSSLDLMSATMNQLLSHSKAQTAVMASMQQEMNGMNEKMQNMEEEITHLREKCDILPTLKTELHDVKNRLRYHEMLIKNQKWKYSAPIRSSINPQSREFIDEIKNITCDMRRGDIECGDIKVSYNVPYDEAFLPHWREFALALKDFQCELKCLPEARKSSLSISWADLPMEVLDLLSRTLRSTHFKRLRLEGNRFGREGITFALNYIQNNPILEEFHLVSNHFESREEVERLCQIIQGHPSLHTIELDNCRDADGEIDGHDMLSSVMSAGASKLKAIDLANNGISTVGSTFIADFLATNPILEKLTLFGNELNNDDAKSIAGALKHNTTLTSLNVRENNQMSDAGWGDLRNALFDNTSLNSVADSNHTCYAEEDLSGYGISSINRSRDGDSNDCPKRVRQKKIYCILSARNKNSSNAQWFNDVPVEFLPDMLQSIQQYSEYHIGMEDGAPEQDEEDSTPLSIVFEVLQKWDKSVSLYELLGNS